MQAELLAGYPRNAAENATVNWGQVATYAAAGLSSGTRFDFKFYNDRVNMIDGEKNWSNDITTMRVDTRLAKIITAGPDPSKIHADPWPDPRATRSRTPSTRGWVMGPGVRRTTSSVWAP